MYQFIDINAHQSGTILPSEALKVNGVYIEEPVSYTHLTLPTNSLV